jgi:cytochrome c556
MKRMMSQPAAISRLLCRAVLILACTSCATAPVEAPVGPGDQVRRSELGVFMKTEMNPPFSKLSFLLFHDADEDVDANALPATAGSLARSAGKLAIWLDAPGESDQGKSIFHDYAMALKADAATLQDALRSGRRDDAIKSFDSLRKKCDSCHHFFRYDETAGLGVVNRIADAR